MFTISGIYHPTLWRLMIDVLKDQQHLDEIK